MRNRKRGGKHLRKKVHHTKEYFRRGLSLLLGLCMVLSMLEGVSSFTARAWDSDPEAGQAEPGVEPQAEPQAPVPVETREEIKARLLRQIRKEGWDPYGSDMTMDEFYALMEMFQEGILPLENDGPVTEPGVGPETGEPDTQEDPDTPEVPDIPEDPDTPEDPDIPEDPDAQEDPDIPEDPDAPEDPDTPENPDAQEDPDIPEDPDTPEVPDIPEDPDTLEDPDTPEGPDIPEEPGTQEGPVVEGPQFEGPWVDMPPVEGPASAPSQDAAPVNGPEVAADGDPDAGEDNTEEPDDPVIIPRNMFLFRKLSPEGAEDASMPGRDVGGNLHGSPLAYDNVDGHMPEDDYGPGLDVYESGYTRPPMSWDGVITGMADMKAVVIVPDINKDNPTIASNVDQNLFLEYDGYYVYRVTAQNNDVNVLGAVPVGSSYVYYYTNYLLQDTTVSVTTLPEGEKFIIEYEPSEYTIKYRVLLAGSETYDANVKVSRDNIIDWIRERLEKSDWENPQTAIKAPISDVTAKYREMIYGTYLPEQSDLGAYAFTAKTLDGYTLSFYMVKGEGGSWGEPVLQLGTIEETKDWQKEPTIDSEGHEKTWQMEHGLYTTVNGGWALGEEPYYHIKRDFKIISENHESPEYLTLNGTFYNNTLDANREIVAVLRKKPTPQFSIAEIVAKSSGTVDRAGSAVRTVTVKNRATGATETVPYDYEDEYLWRKYGDKAPDEAHTSKYTDYKNGNPIGNIQTRDGFNWQKGMFTEDMELDEASGTYSYQWTFQTNNNSGGYRLDAFEINRVGVSIPFFTKYMERTAADTYNESRCKDSEGNPRDNTNDTGIYSWSTTTSLPDGAIATVEFLIIFNDGTPQRVYRVTVTGAKNNVTITALNLMMGTGAPEFSTYDLDGVTGATSNGTSDLRLAAVQYYGNHEGITGWGKSSKPQSNQDDNVNRGNVIVKSINYRDNGDSSGTTGGDGAYGGANFRFKLADGYANPYYLYESSHDGVISGALNSDDIQASVNRNKETGEVERSTQNDVVPFISNGDDPYMAYYVIESGGGGRFVHPPDANSPQEAKDDFVKAVPIPVYLDENKDRKPLYDAAGQLYTDWGMIQISTDGNGNEVLYPALYDAPKNGKLLQVGDVIVGWGDPVFSETDSKLLKSKYIYRGASNNPEIQSDDNFWYYIRVSGQGKWTGTSYPDPEGGYMIALLTIVAYPMRYMVRYKPGTMPDYTNGDLSVPGGDRKPADMPTWDHNHDGKEDRAELNDADCPAFPYGHTHDPEKPHAEFEDDDGKFYNVESNYDIAIVTARPRDPEGYFEFQGWRLVDADDKPVLAHVFDETGKWKTDGVDENGHPIYVYTTVTFRSGSFDLRNYAQFAIENEGMGGDSNDIYVLRLMPVWTGIDAPYHYNVALNWVDVDGVVHTDYFDDYWSETVTSFDPGEEKDNLVVKVLTESTPLRNWFAQNGTYAYWDVVNNAENDGEIETALRDYYEDKLSNWNEGNPEDRAKFEAALEELLKRYKEGNTSGKPEFDRKGNYTYTITGDGGTIIIWMEEIFGALEFHKEIETEPFIHDEEYYFTVEGDPAVFWDESQIYYAYPDKENVQAKEGWEVRFNKDGKIANIKKYDDSVPWPEKPVTYFTLYGGDGIKLYIPGGNYTIYELGSKSGGSYQAAVVYEDKTANRNNVGNEWIVPGDPTDPAKFVWLTGSEKEYRENVSGISQLAAKGPVKIGSAHEVRTINFYNRTSTVAFEKVVAGPYYAGDQFEFRVTLTLEAGTEPLQEGGYHYFNFNLYNMFYAPGVEPGKPDDAGEDWRPGGVPEAVTSGRIVVEKVTTKPDGSTTWASRYLLVKKSVWDEAANSWKDSWVKMKAGNDSGGVWLESGQRIYVVCTVPEQGGDINYTIEETNFPGYRVVGDASKDGRAKAAKLAYELFVNSMLVVLPSTGSSDGAVCFVSGTVFLLSGLGLAWLNRDLFRKRRRRCAV